MNKKTISLLEDLFTTVEKTPSAEILPCFKADYMSQFIGNTSTLNEKYPIYQAVSEAMRTSGLSFDFSYSVAQKAVNVLTHLEDWEDRDGMNSEYIDSEVPVYNHELMQIYLSDWWAVDEVAEEFGDIHDTMQGARMAWFKQIEQMVEAIINNLKED